MVHPRWRYTRWILHHAGVHIVGRFCAAVHSTQVESSWAQIRRHHAGVHVARWFGSAVQTSQISTAVVWRVKKSIKQKIIKKDYYFFLFYKNKNKKTIVCWHWFTASASSFVKERERESTCGTFVGGGAREVVWETIEAWLFELHLSLIPLALSLTSKTAAPSQASLIFQWHKVLLYDMLYNLLIVCGSFA